MHIIQNMLWACSFRAGTSAAGRVAVMSRICLPVSLDHLSNPTVVRSAMPTAAYSSHASTACWQDLFQLFSARDSHCSCDKAIRRIEKSTHKHGRPATTQLDDFPKMVTLDIGSKGQASFSALCPPVNSRLVPHNGTDAGQHNGQCCSPCLRCCKPTSATCFDVARWA